MISTRTFRTGFSAALLSLLASASPARAQTNPRGPDASVRDTVPTHVVQRSIDAWKRKDLNGIFAEYDSAFFHMFLGDTVVERVTRAAMIARMKADTGFVQFMNTGQLIKSDVNARGTWVFNVFTWRDAKGKETMTLDVYRVLRGKIVYEIEG